MRLSTFSALRRDLEQVLLVPYLSRIKKLCWFQNRKCIYKVTKCSKFWTRQNFCYNFWTLGAICQGMFAFLTGRKFLAFRNKYYILPKRKNFPSQGGCIFYKFRHKNLPAKRPSQVRRKVLQENIRRYCFSFLNCMKLCNLKIWRCLVSPVSCSLFCIAHGWR
jgi:hypothetical protein